MKFLSLEKKEELEEITGAKGAQIIFKHNTTCPISKGVLRRLREGEDVLPPNIPFYILDLLTYRSISDAIAKKYDVPHQSPQLLLIKDGKCIYNQSLYDISAEDTAEAINASK